MILAVAATEFEMQPFLEAARGQSFRSLICGVGPLESGMHLTRYLCEKKNDIRIVVHFGVAGAYTGGDGNVPQLLDICLAETEVFGDLGICFPRRMDDLPADLTGERILHLDASVRERATNILLQQGLTCLSGNFVTVAAVSGTWERGEILRKKYRGLCENMEGAAIARVCREFSLPMLEIRCVSNRVEDRNPEGWKLQQACGRSGSTAAIIIERLEE